MAEVYLVIALPGEDLLALAAVARSTIRLGLSSPDARSCRLRVAIISFSQDVVPGTSLKPIHQRPVLLSTSDPPFHAAIQNADMHVLIPCRLSNMLQEPSRASISSTALFTTPARKDNPFNIRFVCKFVENASIPVEPLSGDVERATDATARVVFCRQA